ncbi:unnamed protein product [Periconia digitata]|uniref:Uncharacterized protein n=1 Tax=Periconia digitata TaxID=1303443 RepID=A0A9W4U6V1_9PLEO|nr:unnamed protein product [Periconia digitata]
MRLICRLTKIQLSYVEATWPVMIYGNLLSAFLNILSPVAVLIIPMYSYFEEKTGRGSDVVGFLCHFLSVTDLARFHSKITHPEITVHSQVTKRCNFGCQWVAFSIYQSD